MQPSTKIETSDDLDAHFDNNNVRIFNSLLINY